MDNHGVLVGWTHHDMGQKLVLNLQTIKQADMPKEVDRTAILLTKDQAALLGNYLFQVAGQSPPVREQRSWFKRMFG